MKKIYNENKSNRAKPLFAAIAVLTAPAVHAATITQDEQAGFNFAQSWNQNATMWDDDNAASAGNDYIANNRIVGQNGDSTFAGDSLTLAAGGNLQLHDNVTSTANIIADGGQIGMLADGIGTLAGTLSVNDATNLNIVLRDDGTNTRNLIISSTVSGGTTSSITTQVTSSGNDADTTISNAANTFAGTWVADEGNLIFGNAGSVGISASISVAENAFASVGGDWIGNILLAESGAEVSVGDNNFTVNNLIANGTTFEAGTFDIAELNTIAGETIFSGGTGSITVVPEPSVALLGGIGLLGLLRRRR